MDIIAGHLTEPFDCLPAGEEVEVVSMRGTYLLNYGAWDDAASIQLSEADVEHLKKIIKPHQILSKADLEEIYRVHENEAWWYLFLSYGCPVENKPQFEEKYNAVREALKEYIKFINQQESIHFPGEESKLWL